MARYLRPLALLGLAGLTAAGPANPTCAGEASHGDVYTAAAGGQYDILCGTDYAGGDIAATNTPTFAGCIDACDANPKCIDVSYAGESCYMKGSLGTAYTDRSWVWTAKKRVTNAVTPTNSPTCDGGASDKTTFTSTGGKTFQILCGVDYGGGDMGATNTPTFAACINACSDAQGCVDVSYVNGACYMKNTLNTLNQAGHVWTAKLVPAGGNSGTQTPPTPNAKLSCEGNKDNGKIFEGTNYNFEITCGIDYAGGDLLGTSADSFEACMKACDANPACVNVAYAAPGCYLKGEQKPAVNNAAVWGAIRKPKTGSTNPDPETTPNAPAGPLSCVNKANHGVRYGVPNGGLYQVLCGVDYGGNDLDATATESFEACIAACDKNEKCVDVSFVAPSCYMKSAAEGTPSEAAHVWTAKQLKTASQVGLWPTVGNSDPGEGEEIFDFSEPIELPGAPVAQLGPVAPPGINMAGTGVLTPEPATQLWFNGTQTGAEGEDLGAVTVRLNITYKYPSIVLDHSIFIKDVVCEAGGALNGRFNSSAPYFFAKDTWVVDNSDVLLITSVPSCISGDTTTAFFLTHTVSFDDATFAFEALGQAVELADVFDDLDVDFGNITVDESAGDDAFNTACGSPSSDTIQGLPAVPCGFDFDEALDKRRGYYSDNGADVQVCTICPTPHRCPDGG